MRRKLRILLGRLLLDLGGFVLPPPSPPRPSIEFDHTRFRVPVPVQRSYYNGRGQEVLIVPELED